MSNLDKTDRCDDFRCFHCMKIILSLIDAGCEIVIKPSFGLIFISVDGVKTTHVVSDDYDSIEAILESHRQFISSKIKEVAV